MSVELPNFPNIPGSPRWVEVARDRDRILQARIAELEAVKKEADHARAEQARATSERSDSLAFAIVDDALSGLLRAIDAAMKETKP